MNLTAYIVDDESHAINVLEEYIRRTPEMELIGVQTDPLIALNEIIGKKPPDISFLDVDMPGLTGMELAGLISQQTTIVFTTSYKEFAQEAFEKDAADYLLKPIGYERFLKCVQKIRSLKLHTFLPDIKEQNSFFVKSTTRGKLVRIPVEDILYIEAAGNYVHIYLQDEKVTTYLTIEELAEKLPRKQFLRTHRSFVVNANLITAVQPGGILLGKQAIVPLGRSYKEDFLSSLRPDLLLSKRDQQH